MKRKGYNDIKKQIEANERYLDNNGIAKIRANRSRLKSTCYRFIKEFSTLDELNEIKDIINNKIKGVKNMSGFEKLGFGWFILKERDYDVFVVALKKDVNVWFNTMRGCYMSTLKENAKCLNEEELKQFFKEKTGKDYTAEELRKPSLYKKYLDDLAILNFGFDNKQIISGSDYIESF